MNGIYRQGSECRRCSWNLKAVNSVIKLLSCLDLRLQITEVGLNVSLTYFYCPELNTLVDSSLLVLQFTVANISRMQHIRKKTLENKHR